MKHRLISLIRTQGLGLLALFLVLTSGAAYAAAAAAAKDSVVSRSIKNGQVKTVDLREKAVTGDKFAADAVTGGHVANGTLSGEDITNNSLTGDDITNNSLTGDDVADSSLVGNDLRDNTVTGADVNESTLGTVNNAAALSGLAAADLLRSSVYKKQSTSSAGTVLGDGTFTQALACDAGDVLLSGGPGDLSATTDTIESVPSGGAGVTNSWTVRVNKNGNADDYVVVILCVNQTA